ncbi:hypothetical protein BU17DRAFT_72137 [Hysterangium stoloniferum]|nr:hypothetical protein BU17DRAFT_72137 [Hysterangium stoloniferum]
MHSPTIPGPVTSYASNEAAPSIYLADGMDDIEFNAALRLLETKNDGKPMEAPQLHYDSDRLDKNFIPPIHDFPIEIVQRILLFYIPPPHFLLQEAFKDPKNTMSLTLQEAYDFIHGRRVLRLVCKWWKVIIDDTPEGWSTIPFLGDTPISIKCLDYLLGNAKRSLLDIIIDARYWNMAGPDTEEVMNRLGEYRNQIRSFVMFVPKRFFDNGTFPFQKKVEMLNLEVFGLYDTHDQFQSLNPMRIESHSLTSLVTTFLSTQLGCFTSDSIATLTWLNIQRCRTSYIATIMKCRSLETLIIDQDKVDPPDAADLYILTESDLPNLSHFSFHAASSFHNYASLFEALDQSPLQSVRLRCSHNPTQKTDAPCKMFNTPRPTMQSLHAEHAIISRNVVNNLPNIHSFNIRDCELELSPQSNMTSITEDRSMWTLMYKMEIISCSVEMDDFVQYMKLHLERRPGFVVPALRLRVSHGENVPWEDAMQHRERLLRLKETVTTLYFCTLEKIISLLPTSLFGLP